MKAKHGWRVAWLGGREAEGGAPGLTPLLYMSPAVSGTYSSAPQTAAHFLAMFCPGDRQVMNGIHVFTQVHDGPWWASSCFPPRSVSSLGAHNGRRGAAEAKESCHQEHSSRRLPLYPVCGHAVCRTASWFVGSPEIGVVGGDRDHPVYFSK